MYSTSNIYYGENTNNTVRNPETIEQKIQRLEVSLQKLLKKDFAKLTDSEISVGIRHYLNLSGYYSRKNVPATCEKKKLFYEFYQRISQESIRRTKERNNKEVINITYSFN